MNPKDIQPGTKWSDGRVISKWRVTDTSPHYWAGKKNFDATVYFTDGTQVSVTVSQ
jgi:hypothetical protein